MKKSPNIESEAESYSRGGRKRRRKGGAATGMMAQPRLDRKSRKPPGGGMGGPLGAPAAGPGLDAPMSKPAVPPGIGGGPPTGSPDDDAMMKKGGKTKGFHPGGSPGKLHREMGVPEGEKIPADKLAAAARSPDPEKRRDAIRAETMKKWHHGG